MHVLLIHQAFTGPDESGGTRHYELASRFVQKKGHKFTIVASNLSYLTGKRAGRKNVFLSQQHLKNIQVFRVYTLPSLHRNFIWRVFSFISFMVISILAAKRAKDIDLVIGTSPPIFQAVSAYFISFLRRRPFLLEIRDLWPEFAIDMGVLRNPILICLSRWLEHFLYRRASHLLVNSPAYKDYLLKKGIPSEKISFISNGVDTSLFFPEMKGDQQRLKWNTIGKFVITYAGALGQANDIWTILKAARRLIEYPNIHFILAGDGKERKNLEKKSKDMGLFNLTFIGAIPKSQMPMLLAATDACIATLLNIPMFRTTYPNKVFDYMAAGRPIILGIDGVVRQVVEDAGAGICVPPGDDKALAEAVLMLEKDRERTKEMGTSARKYVTVHFDREKQAEEFAQLLLKSDQWN